MWEDYWAPYTYHVAPAAASDFTLHIEPKAVFEQLAAAPGGTLGGFPIEGVDRARWLIWVSTGVTQYSWGEYVMLRFYQPMPGSTRIILESRPRGPQDAPIEKHQYNLNVVYTHIMNTFYPPNRPMW